MNKTTVMVVTSTFVGTITTANHVEFVRLHFPRW